jgi:hypothetical protein
MGRTTTEREVDQVLDALAACLPSVRDVTRATAGAAS